MKNKQFIESVKNRKELATLLEKLNSKGIRAKINRSVKEGYRYDVSYTKAINECANKSISKKSIKEGYNTDFSTSGEVFDDLKDRAIKSFDEETEDIDDAIDEAVRDAIDAGLSYTQDVVLISSRYVHSSDLLNMIYDDLYDDLYHAVKTDLGLEDIYVADDYSEDDDKLDSEASLDMDEDLENDVDNKAVDTDDEEIEESLEQPTQPSTRAAHSSFKSDGIIKRL